MPTVPSDLSAEWAAYRNEPCDFVARFWPRVRLAPYQVDIMRSVVRNTETWVQSAHETGKSFTAALTALWWFLTRPGIVVCLSPAQSQLHDVLWQEILSLLAPDMRQAFGLAVNFLDIRRLDEAGAKQPKSYLVGKCVAKDQTLAGVHLATLPDDTPTVLYVAEEVSDIDDRFWPVIRSCRHRLLAIGNPVSTSGEFYAACSRGDQPHPTDKTRLWSKRIIVAGKDSPNVQVAERCIAAGKPLPKRPPVPGLLSYEEYLNRRATYAPWEARPRLDGLFNDESTAKLFPAAWLDYGQQLYQRLKTMEPERSKSVRRWLYHWGFPFALGVDCAMGGGDMSAWCVYGRFGCVHVETLDTPNTRAIKAKTLALMKRWKIRPEAVYFDRAIGKGIADEMREQGLDVGDVSFGAGRTQEGFDGGRFSNMRCQLYGEVMEAMARQFDDEGKLRANAAKLLEMTPAQWRELKKVRPVALPDDQDLRQELFVLPRQGGSDGRLTLPPKDGEKGRIGVKQMLGGRSPDKADALVLARWGFERGQEHQRLSRIDGPLVY